MNSGDTGILRVAVRTAGDALPIAGAIISVYGTEEEDGLIRVTRSDASGLSEAIVLDALPSSLSMSAGNSVVSTRYRVQVRADGYAAFESRNVPVFAGITSWQTAHLVPLPQ